jgi:hypothetical protein
MTAVLFDTKFSGSDNKDWGDCDSNVLWISKWFLP